MELQHLVDLISELPKGSRLKYVRSDEVCTFIDIDTKQARVSARTPDGKDFPFAGSYLSTLSKNIRAYVPFNISQLMNNSGSNRPVIETIVAHTREFYWIQAERAKYVVWVPDKPHTAGELVQWTDMDYLNRMREELKDDSNEVSTLIYRKLEKTHYTEEELVSILQEINQGKNIGANLILFALKYGEFFNNSASLQEKAGMSSSFSDAKAAYDLIKQGGMGIAFYDPERTVILPNATTDKARQTIYYGAPGTGKTHKLKVEFNRVPKDNRFIVTFHQAYSYEEFIEGIKAETNNGNLEYKCVEGIFYQACERAAQLAGFEPFMDMDALQVACNASYAERNEKFFAAAEKGAEVLFCIDEINRGNVSAIFGDLISLIEDTKRLGIDETEELIVTLPYSKKKFGVPANLRILATMNTADRSIQALDTALRRRFTFEECPPEPEKLANDRAKEILKAINGKIRALIDKDHQIGHSFFWNIPTHCDDEALRIFVVMKNKIIPLLQEYFYNDIDKIRYVLNEGNDAPQDGYRFYILDKEASEAHKEREEDEVDIYRLNEEGLNAVRDNVAEAEKYIAHLSK